MPHASRLRPPFWPLAALPSGAIEFLDTAATRDQVIGGASTAGTALPDAEAAARIRL